MNPFKNRKDKKEEKKQESIEDLTSRHNLNELSLEDKEYVTSLIEGMRGTTAIGFTSSAEDTAKIGLLQTIIEQNFLTIKLLNEISNKLDN